MAGEAIAAVAFDDRKPAIVTTTYRYKRPPRKRKAVPLVAIVKRKAKPELKKTLHDARFIPPANDDRKPAIVTAQRPGARSLVDVPDMKLEEHQRRGEAADALFREIVRRDTE